MRNLLLVLFVTFSISTFAQDNSVYNESVDGMEQINKAIAQARSQEKHVLVQVGGNWCKWCIKLHDWIDGNLAVKNHISKNFVYINVNYSEKNKNHEAMKFLRNPGRLAFPSLHIVNQDGEVIQSMKLDYLMNEDKYDERAFIKFLNDFTPTAVEYNH